MVDRLPVFISAGDPSGDIAGSHLIGHLRSPDRQLAFLGLGGSRMAAAGQEQLIKGEKLAVLGFWEVAKKFLFFKKLMADSVALIEKKKPRAVILIDYPGFNMRLAAKIRHLNIPVVYYISPQIWAWGGRRIKRIGQLVDLMLLILPFEKKIYDGAGIKNEFVGHYLLDDIAPALIKSPYNNRSDLVILMPGSRPQEVDWMLPTMLDAAAILARKGQWRFTVAAVKGDIDYRKYLSGCLVPVEIAYDRARELIAAGRLVIASSGTATLETGIIGRPMVVIYKTGLLTYLITRGLITIDMIGLINIAAGEKIVPELIQREAVPAKIADEAIRFLDDENLSLEVAGKLNAITDCLGGPGAARRAAEAIREYINC
ncbi:MAG: lipid-A-disaccharide synthase [Candidatus Zixiibacteriota bacterium]|nr:MAG: lipid-A-disaccharide synthase [candidate division Zixibacteria bacterium]